MNKFLLLSVAFAAVASTAQAAPPKTSPASPYAAAYVPKPPKPVLHVPVGSMTTQGDPAAIAAAGYFAVDTPVPLVCESKNGCTIIIIATVQAAATVDDTQWAICPEVDSRKSLTGCGYVGKLNTADGYNNATQTMELPVTRGRHSGQTLLFLAQPGYVGNYHVTYQITTP